MKKVILFLSLTVLIISCSTSQNVEENTENLINKNGDIVDPSFYQEKFLSGIVFFARGNEPNWVLEIDFEKGMHISTMDGMELSTPAAKRINAQDADITLFKASVESGDLAATISRDECFDSMSGEKFDYSVGVEVKFPSENDVKIFAGCGRYLYDYRLNDIWVMEEMTKVDLKNSELMKGLPKFEFNLRNMRFSGHAGCNNLFGEIELKGHQIKFGNIGSTMMACPDMSVEQAIISALNLKTFSYKIENMGLILENDSIKMVFKKVD